MNAYCERQGFQRAAIRFMFDGSAVGEEQSPQDVSIVILLHIDFYLMPYLN